VFLSKPGLPLVLDDTVHIAAWDNAALASAAVAALARDTTAAPLLEGTQEEEVSRLGAGTDLWDAGAGAAAAAAASAASGDGGKLWRRLESNAKRDLDIASKEVRDCVSACGRVRVASWCWRVCMCWVHGGGAGVAAGADACGAAVGLRVARGCAGLGLCACVPQNFDWTSECRRIAAEKEDQAEASFGSRASSSASSVSRVVAYALGEPLVRPRFPPPPPPSPPVVFPPLCLS
jgi:hypothetical protein